ncbi:DUF6843 domain-containing protein [Chryseobacterium arachidis]|nr:hypothetical protein [Chryseobacterium arachidis]
MKTAISLVLFILILNSCRGSRPEPEIYLIPTSYRGKVNVIFNQAKGQEIMYEGDKRVYRIPENGILLTKAKPEYGFIRHEYHFVDSSGKRTLIKILFDNHENTEEIGIYRDGTVGIYGNSDDIQNLKYQEFYVTDKKSLDKYFSIQYDTNFLKAVQQLTGIDF